MIFMLTLKTKNNALNQDKVIVIVSQFGVGRVQMKDSYFKSDDDYDNMDVYQLFNFYNIYFFQGVLQKCTVEWSQKMTLCAGSCANTYYQSCVIKLSEPILKFRTANEIKETLLHEMIHAYLFLTNPRACQGQGGHGPEFKEIMNQINAITGLSITVFHNFHDEVDLYRKHIWRCDGLCQSRPPFYGYVKRAMNRKPQPADHWFREHQRTCGGNFIKVSGPDSAASKNKRMSKEKKERNWGSGKTIDQYFKQMKEGKNSKKKMGKNEKFVIDKPNEMKQNVSSASSIFLKGKAKSLSDYCKEVKLQGEARVQNDQKETVMQVQE